MECGQPLKPSEYFCGDRCWDQWQDGRNLTPGYTLVAMDISPKEGGGRGKNMKRENAMPGSTAFPEYEVDYDSLPF